MTLFSVYILHLGEDSKSYRPEKYHHGLDLSFFIISHTPHLTIHGLVEIFD